MGKNFPDLHELEKTALAYIAENGAVSSDTLPIEGEIYWHSSMHWSGNWDKKSKAARSVLEQLYTDGVLIIHHKSGSRKYYDIAERHIDCTLLTAPDPYADTEEKLRWRVLRRIGAVGLLWDKNSTAYLGIDINAESRKRVLASLIDEHKVVQVNVEGIKTPFYYCCWYKITAVMI